MGVEVKQLHPLFGGEISGVDIAKPLSDTDFADIKAAMDQYGFLVFHGERLSEDQQITFAERFGVLDNRGGVLATGIKRRVGTKLVDVSNLNIDNAILGAGERKRMYSLGNRLWHTDASFKRVPAKYSMLHGLVVPPEDGDTEIVDTRAAYDALSDKMKAQLEGLIVEHSIFTSRSKLGFDDFSDDERRDMPPVCWELARRHEESGRTALYIASHASHVVGMPVPVGRMLIHELIEHATKPQFVYAHKWQAGDLIMWDNRCTMHRARPFDDAGQARDMRRATILDFEHTPIEQAEAS